MRVLKMMIIGIFFGLAFSYSTLSIVAFLNEDTIISGSYLFREFVIAIVLGGVIGIGTKIFDFDRFPFTVQLLIHYLYVTTCVLVAGKIAGWYDGVLSLGLVMLIQVLIYILVWVILYIVQERDINEINEQIKRIKEK